MKNEPIKMALEKCRNCLNVFVSFEAMTLAKSAKIPVNELRDDIFSLSFRMQFSSCIVVATPLGVSMIVHFLPYEFHSF